RRRGAERGAAAGKAAAGADDGAAHLGLLARHRLPVRPWRRVGAQAADDAGRTAGGGGAALSSRPRGGRRRRGPGAAASPLTLGGRMPNVNVSYIHISPKVSVMTIAETLDEVPRPAWIALMVLSFIVFWPLGLAILAYLIWSRRMACWSHGRGWHNGQRYA